MTEPTYNERRRWNAEIPETHRPYVAAADRYASMEYRRVGTSGLFLPPLSLGFWYNFGDNRPLDTQRAIVRHAFDRGITHFDLANNYGPPYGSAERNFGILYREDLKPYRNELVISTKAGWDMWPGPMGEFGSRKYVLASLDESLERMGLDYVDIFYSHRPDPSTPMEETMSALAEAVGSGRARYVGVSSYSAERTERMLDLADELGVPLVIHQPSYSLLNRWIERGLTDVLQARGMGSIVFTALAQGLLTGKYLGEGPAQRSMHRPSFDDHVVTGQVRERLRALNGVAERRGQSLAQLALAWVLHNPAVTSALIGVSSVQQLDENLATLDNLDFTAAELAEIDEHAVDSSIDLWATESTT